MQKFMNKVVLVTGGTSGIGKATAAYFIQQGATVIITGRYQHTIDATIQELGPACKGIVSDAGDTGDLMRLRNKISAITPRVDVLFANAGYGKFASIESSDMALFDELFNLHTKGAFFTVQQVLPLMQKGASIVLCTSVVTQVGIAHFSVYSAAKAAVQSFVKTWAAELLERGIRVNGVSPGYIATNIFHKTGMTPQQVDAVVATVTPALPMKRFGHAAEVAHTVGFLASDEAAYINGTEILVDGAWTIVKN